MAEVVLRLTGADEDLSECSHLCRLACSAQRHVHVWQMGSFSVAEVVLQFTGADEALACMHTDAGWQAVLTGMCVSGRWAASAWQRWCCG